MRGKELSYPSCRELDQTTVLGDNMTLNLQLVQATAFGMIHDLKSSTVDQATIWGVFTWVLGLGPPPPRQLARHLA